MRKILLLITAVILFWACDKDETFKEETLCFEKNNYEFSYEENNQKIPIHSNTKYKIESPYWIVCKSFPEYININITVNYASEPRNGKIIISNTNYTISDTLFITQTGSPNSEGSGNIGGNDQSYSGRCQAITQKGTRCKRKADKGSIYCWQHRR